MRDKDPPPDHLRCNRNDGRKWRCKRRAMDGKMLCDVHHLQGKHRQNKEKVPESLKLERTVIKKRGKINGESSSRVPTKIPAAAAEKRRRRRISEALDDALKRLKWKKGDLQLELIRVFLKRQVEKKKEKEMEENAIGDETMELPYGIMAISQSPPSLMKLRENGGLDVKLGVDSNGNSFMQRHFRSKNIEPLPITSMQVIPFAKNVKKKIKKCHWCRQIKTRCMIRCLTCRKRFFCVECIKERYFEKQEVKVKCPACMGTCSCKLCMKQQFRANNNKECYKGERKLKRKQLLQYLVYMLLPLLKQINSDQTIELEIEAKITGKEQSEVQIDQTKLGFQTLRGCNRCKTSIVDYHRTCPNCSYNLCLSCCRELSQHSLHGSFQLKRCTKRKISSSGDDLLFKQKPPCLSRSSLEKWEARTCGSIPCPPKSIGGCGESLLDLRCIYPFTWTRDLEARAEEILCSYQFPETEDDSPCLLCKCIDFNDGEVKSQTGLSRRAGSSDNYLYCPTVKDIHQESLGHFQNHWGKGHPVIVRNVLGSTSGLCWDPFNMLCSYMESKCSESCDENGMKATNCSDWCEVEIDRKRIFMGSLEKRTHASMQQKVVKFKAWLSSHLFQKQFPGHYDEILNALPLPEYINPVSGLLNVGVKLPKELPKPDLGPCVYFSYGGPEELMRADFLSKLCYESHDTVNILAYATDVPISAEQISNIESLMKKHKARDHHGQSSSSSDQKCKSSLQSEDTGESGLHDVGEKTNLPNGVDDHHKDKAENGNLSDDSESDDEASILCCGSIDNSEDSDEFFQTEDIESSCSSEDKQGTSSCGAQWDIFRRQDVPKLIEYLKRHSTELTSGSACSYSKNVHPILDQNFFLDPYHKLRLKEEFEIQPWTFEQFPGEAIFIPAGCPYQIRKFKSCVNVVLDFISPENATRCIQLADEIRLLPVCHKAMFEVKKMAVHGISSAIEDLSNLTDV